jgi:hypothetical protein
MQEDIVHVSLEGHELYSGMYAYIRGSVVRYRFHDVDGYHDDWVIHSSERLSLRIDFAPDIADPVWLHFGDEDTSDFLDAHPEIEEALIHVAVETDWMLYEPVEEVSNE